MKISTEVVRVVSAELPASLEALWKALTEEHHLLLNDIQDGHQLELATFGKTFRVSLRFSYVERPVRFPVTGGLHEPPDVELAEGTPDNVRALIDSFVAAGFRIKGADRDKEKGSADLTINSSDAAGGKLHATAKVHWS